MKYLTVQVPDDTLTSILQALTPLVPPNAIQLFEPLPISKEPEDDGLGKLALQVLEIVRPKPSQPMRKEALQKLLNRHDTFWDQGGEPDPALRNAMGALSKALRAVFPHDQAIRRLAVPKKTFMDNGAYQGTAYVITPLGKRVRDLLKAEGIL